jgi:hypothetical protein
MISLQDVENYYDFLIDQYCENEPLESELEEIGKYHVVDNEDNIIQEIDSDYLNFIVNGNSFF